MRFPVGQFAESLERCTRSPIFGAAEGLNVIVHRMTRLPTLLAAVLVGSIATACGLSSRSEAVGAAKSPEQVVFARSKDDVVSGGMLFAPEGDSAKPVAIVWIHGWGVNFYQPTYVAIGRALAHHGYTVIDGNTRMHDLGNVEVEHGGKRVRGGGYWGVASEEPRDIAAWIDLAEANGFKRVVLVGHSAGWGAVRSYVAQVQDPRVVGLVLASGSVQPDLRISDPDQLREARRLVASGEGEALIRDPKRTFPSYISAATFLDIDAFLTDSGARDFFGVQTANAPIARVRIPLLAFFGTHDDVGGQADLDTIASAIRRRKSGVHLTTALIGGGDHMYTDQEQQVADIIARWAADLAKSH
jgi:pimeloyl-ACP methyl ester carboxylesterase